MIRLNFGDSAKKYIFIHRYQAHNLFSFLTFEFKFKLKKKQIHLSNIKNFDCLKFFPFFKEINETRLENFKWLELCDDSLSSITRRGDQTEAHKYI